VKSAAAADGLRAAFADPSMQLLAELQLPLDVTKLFSTKRPELLTALPPTCRRLTLEAFFRGASDAAGLVGALPPTVRVLSVVKGRAERLLDDRLTEVEVCYAVDEAGLEKLVAALDATTMTVRLRLSWLPRALPPHPRITVGRPGDAALVARDSGRLIPLPRPSLRELQRVHGLVPIHAHLGRTLPERHRLEPWDGVAGLFTRDGDGQWTLKREQRDPRHQVSLNGAPLAPRTSAPLRDGDRLLANDVEWTFVEDVARLGAL